MSQLWPIVTTFFTAHCACENWLREIAYGDDKIETSKNRNEHFPEPLKLAESQLK